MAQTEPNPPSGARVSDAGGAVSQTVPIGRATKRATSIIVEGNVAGKPVRGAKASVTTLAGRELKILGKQPKTNSSGMASFQIRGKHRKFVVSLSGGNYGYTARGAKSVRGSIDGAGSAGAVATLVSPETALAVAELRSGGSTSVRQAVARTQQFLRLPNTGTAFDLGYQTGADGSAWPAADFNRLVRKSSGYQAFATDSAQLIGRDGETLWSARKQQSLGEEEKKENWKTKFGKGILSFFKGGIGNLINFGLCQAADLLPPGVSTFAGVFLDCGGGTDLTEVNKKLDNIQASITDLTKLVESIDAAQKTDDFGKAYDNSKLGTLLSAIGRAEVAQKVLAQTGSQSKTPTGSAADDIKGDALCALAYGKATAGLGQTVYGSCVDLWKVAKLFTENDQPVADTLYHALGAPPNSTVNLIARYQSSLSGGGKFPSGAEQRQLLQFYVQALSAQQSAFLTSITWAQFRESWTGDHPTCQPLPQNGMPVESARVLSDSCELANTALHDLSVEMEILRSGPDVDVDPSVLIDPKSGFSWWRYAFDGAGQTLRQDNPAEPFFDKPAGNWSKDGLARKVYGSVSDAGNTPFGLPGGTDQRFQVPTMDQSSGLVSNVRKAANAPNDGVAKLLADRGFVGPDSDAKAEKSRGMDWKNLGLDLKRWRFDQRSGRYPSISWTYDGDHYWGGYLNNKSIEGVPCDTRAGHADAVSDEDLWPYLDGVYGCMFVKWGDYVALDARFFAESTLSGAWASHIDDGSECRQLPTAGSTSGATVYEDKNPLCTRDTFGLLVDPNSVLWTDAIFDRVRHMDKIAALVLPPFASVREQTSQEAAFKSISYQISGSQNYEDENAQVTLECSSDKAFKNHRDRALPASSSGTKVVTRTTPVTGESGNWCRIRAVNGGGDSVSGAIKIK